MAIRRIAFERIHGFDESFFLYWEDADLCRRIRTAGYRVMCRPRARVRHEVAQGDLARRVEGQTRSIRVLADRFEGWRRRALGATLVAGFVIRALLRPRRAGPFARAAIPAALQLVAGRGSSSA